MAITSTRGRAMKNLLPRVYDNSEFVDGLLEAVGGEHDLVWEAIDELRDQLYVRTATWGLDRWEDVVGLPRGLGLSDSERQDRIVSRIRGFGVVSKALIRTVAEAYTYGTVGVYDQSDGQPDYTVNISFLDVGGIPSNIIDVENAIREVLPAHLALTFTYNYTTWNEIDTVLAGAPRTWNQWDVADAGGPYTWDEMEVIL